MRSFLLPFALSAIGASVALTACRGTDDPISPQTTSDSTLQERPIDEALTFGDARYTGPSFSGTIQKKGRVVGTDTLDLAELDFFIFERGDISFVGQLDLVGPRRTIYRLDSMFSLRWSRVSVDHYRPGIDSCNYASKTGSVEILKWKDTTIGGATGTLISGVVEGTLAQPYSQKETCLATIPVSFGFRDVHFADNPQ